MIEYTRGNMIGGLAKLLLWVLVLAWLGYGQKPVMSGTAGHNSNQHVNRDENDEFRYVIIAETSNIQRFVNESKHYRNLIVLIEESGFNESNLKTLFKLLSKRFDDRPGLYVNVITSLEAIPTPEEFDKWISLVCERIIANLRMLFFHALPRGVSFATRCQESYR
jgi:hypothetical protein